MPCMILIILSKYYRKLLGMSMSFRWNCEMTEHHSEEGEIFVFGRAKRACQTFAKSRRQRGIECFRFADNAVGGRAVAEAPPRFVDAKAQHFVAEVLPMAEELARRRHSRRRALSRQTSHSCRPSRLFLIVVIHPVVEFVAIFL